MAPKTTETYVIVPLHIYELYLSHIKIKRGKIVGYINATKVKNQNRTKQTLKKVKEKTKRAMVGSGNKKAKYRSTDDESNNSSSADPSSNESSQSSESSDSNSTE
jgi:hypothetical protein